MIYAGVSIRVLDGFSKNGEQYVYIRPSKDCFNRSRRCLRKRENDVIKKWFTPVNYYIIQGKIIGSNSELNALREFWRVCDKSDIGKYFSISPANP